MPGPKPQSGAPRARQGGGFNTSPGGESLGEEHQDQAAIAQAVQQKALGQQASQSNQNPLSQMAKGSNQQQNPRAPAGPIQEAKWFAQDIVKGLGQFFDVGTLLGDNPEDSPEDKAKKQKIHQNWQKMTQEEQSYAKQLYQKRLQEKQQQEALEQQRKQQEAAQKEQNSLEPPSSGKQKGPQGPGMSNKKKSSPRRRMSSKQRAKEDLESSMKNPLAKIGGAN